MLTHRVPLRFWSLVVAIPTVAALALAAVAGDQTTANPADGRYLATAYDISGITASGLYTHRHIVAADPDILPLGSIIEIRGAGRYSGEYVVADTGAKIQGRHIDIYIPTLAACMKFGVKHVEVRVLQVGKNTDHSAAAAYHQVRQDVAGNGGNSGVPSVAMADAAGADAAGPE
ncbi:MAG: 3D domain-containing protein [Bryobacteraceae bacterium]